MSETRKVGRPTKAEAAAKGITKTELDIGLKMLKKHFPPAMAKAIEISSMEDLPLDKQFKMNLDLVKLYVELLKADKSFKADPDSGLNTDEPELAPVFHLAGMNRS